MNSFPGRAARPAPLTLRQAAEIVGAEPPDTDLTIEDVRSLETAGGSHLALLAHRKYLAAVPDSAAGALLVSAELEGELAREPRPRLVVDDAHWALALLLEHLHPAQDLEPEIHPSAVLGRGVELGEGVRIGPYAVVESEVRVGAGARIGAHAVVGAGARLGREVWLHPHAVVYPGAELGDRVILHAGARVGVDGFGYVFRDGAHRKIPQVGRCVVDADVEIGANTTIDRGSIGETRIGTGCKLDNLVQVGHNVTVGPSSVVAGQAGLAGSARIGSGVLIGGQAGLGGHLTVGDRAQLAGQAGITGDVAAGETVMGFPARPRREFLRTAAAQARVPDLIRRVRELERTVSELGSRLGEAGSAAEGGEGK